MTFKAIGARTSITRPSLYNYYRSREEVLLDLLRQDYADWYADLQQAFAGAPYQSAGKTGTAQVYSLRGAKYRANEIDERLRDHALFMAYAPANKPTIAVALIVENAGWGGSVAAPIARKIFDAWLLRHPTGVTPELKKPVVNDPPKPQVSPPARPVMDAASGPASGSFLKPANEAATSPAAPVMPSNSRSGG